MSSLLVGESYTYAQMVKCLNLPLKGGDSKIAQIKQIEREYRLQKEGIRYNVLGKYKEIKPKPQKAMSSKFNQLFLNILTFSALYPQIAIEPAQDCGSFFQFDFTHTYLYQFLGFPERLHKREETYPFTSKLFEDELYNKCSDKVGDALDGLSSFGYLHYKNSYLVVYPSYRFEEANYDMENRIREATLRAMKIKGFNTLRAVYANKKQEEVHKCAVAILNQMTENEDEQGETDEISALNADDPEEKIVNFCGLWHIYLHKDSIARDSFITEETARKMYRDYFSQINDLFVVALQKRGKTIAEQLFAYPKVWMEIDKPSYEKFQNDISERPLDRHTVPASLQKRVMEIWQSMIDGKYID